MTALYMALMIAGHQGPGLKSPEILAKVLQKYADANSGMGEVTMTQSVSGKKVVIKTELQYQRPSKIYLHQSSDSIAPNDWLLVSDGVNFGYDVPKNISAQRRRLFEPVAITESATGEKKTLKIHSLYIAAKRSLADTLNPFVEFATQTAGEGQSVKAYLVRMAKINDPKEKTLPDGTTCYSIGGTMMFGDPVLDGDGKPVIDPVSQKPKFESAGRFEIQITKDFELIGMSSSESITVKDAASNLDTQVLVVTTWLGKINLNQNPVEAIFKVR